VFTSSFSRQWLSGGRGLAFASARYRGTEVQSVLLALVDHVRHPWHALQLRRACGLRDEAWESETSGETKRAVWMAAGLLRCSRRLLLEE
jgi:hypothetical protein